MVQVSRTNTPRVIRNTVRITSFLVAFLVTGCQQERNFDAQGQIVGFGDDGRTVIIEHAEIPGLMPSMTMPFKAMHADQVAAREVGDYVHFTLFLNADSTWIDGLQLLEEPVLLPDRKDLPEHPGDGTVPITVGELLPDQQLLNQDSTTFSLHQFRGQPLIITFIYTRCPLPDFCPLMSANFQALQRILKAENLSATLLSISFDPTYDTPSVLAAYARRYTQDTDSWWFATGEPESIQKVANTLGVYYQSTTGEIIHNLSTILVGPDLRLKQIWRGNTWSATEVADAIKRLETGT